MTTTTLRERRRRRFELAGATVACVVVFILASMQLDQFRTGDHLYVVMFNVNLVLLGGILLVVLRNGFKLLLERRHKVLGSRLRTRLVLAFVGLSLLPCLLMFLVTTKYVQLSVDFWFKEQVETSMETALDVGRQAYERTATRLVRHAESIRTEILDRKIAFSGQTAEGILSRKRKEYQLAAVAVVTQDAFVKEQQISPEMGLAWDEGKKDVNWENVRAQGSTYGVLPSVSIDYVYALQLVDSNKGLFLLLVEDMGTGFKAKLDRIAYGAEEYSNLRKIKQPLKLVLYSSLGVLTALIILGATWFGFRVAREMTAPIQALAAGTERIARGDLSVRLSDSSSDELGMLIRSFNSMAQDLDKNRQELTGANAMLEEQNLRIARHSKYIETVLENIAAGVISFDHEGHINTVNKAACDILGMEQGQLIAQLIEDILPEPHARNARLIRDRFARGFEARSQYSVSLSIHGEERRLLVNVVGFTTDGVYRGAVGVFEDISELERMQRMSAWREVARRIAHEIKNPLTPIKLSAQRLARKFSGQISDPAFLQSTEMIVRQVEHLLEMVQEFSAFAKLPEVKPQAAELRPLLQGLMDLFRNSHSGIEWGFEVPDDLPLLAMDTEAMSRVFLNIYTNAAEALLMANTAAPFVRTTAVYHAALHLVRISVADNGPGLTEEERTRVFEPYFSHKKGGTGLGLTIVKSIVADHRGYVRVQPREGGGAVFIVELLLA